MPMWIIWVNPRTQKRERIYNYFEQDDLAGIQAIRVSKRALSEKFCVSVQEIPGFRVGPAPWISVPLFREIDLILRESLS